MSDETVKDYPVVLEAAAQSQMDDQERLVSAVIVYEYIDADGHLCMTYERTPGTTPWLVEGLLHRALRHYERLATPVYEDDE